MLVESKFSSFNQKSFSSSHPIFRLIETTSSSNVSGENQLNSVTRTLPSIDDKELNGKDEMLQNSLDKRPYFDDFISKNVTVLVGDTAFLKCRVHNLGNKTVRKKNFNLLKFNFFSSRYHPLQISFIRHSDLHLLTIGKTTYIPDNRFQSVHNSHTDEWSLKVQRNMIFMLLNCFLN
jgi:hypothetical protein